MLTAESLNAIKEVANVTHSVVLDQLNVNDVVLNVRHLVEEEPLGNIQYSQYCNSINGRKALKEYFEENQLQMGFYDAIMLVWGDTPTIDEEVVEEVIEQETSTIIEEEAEEIESVSDSYGDI